MSFSPAWLALREPADHAARAEPLAIRLRDHFSRPPDAGLLRIVDLGCGTGSNLRYLAPRLAMPQHWTLVDNDPAVLRLLPRGPECEPLELDLAREPERLPLGQAELVTAAALLDLVSPEWVDRLVAHLEALGDARPALLFALSYDGRMAWAPEHAADGGIADAFNRHQRTDKGFGPALGPSAGGAAARRLRAAGYVVTRAASDWVLGDADKALQRALATGVASACAAVASATRGGSGNRSGDVASSDDWLRFRLREIDAGRSTLRVGHVDLLALPSPARFSRAPARRSEAPGPRGRPRP